MTKIIYTCILLLITSCSRLDDGNESINEIVVNEAYVFLSPDSNQIISTPVWAKAYTDGFLVYDGQLSFIKFDYDGQNAFSFGRRGRGPGEYQEVSSAAFWKFENNYHVFDRVGAKFIRFDGNGNWVEDILIESDEFPWHSPEQIEAITPQKFIIATKGENNSLIKIVDLENDDALHLGNPVSDFVRYNSQDEVQRAVLSRSIPPSRRNDILIGYNESGIFSFQQTTALLEKYSLSGDLVWSKDLKFPAIEGLFDFFFNIGINRINEGLSSPSTFHYARYAYATQDGFAVLLLNIHEDQPVKVIWVPNDGEDARIVSFPGMENDHPFQPRTFFISHDQSHIYFLNGLSGEIFKATWPI